MRPSAPRLGSIPKPPPCLTQEPSTVTDPAFEVVTERLALDSGTVEYSKNILSHAEIEYAGRFAFEIDRRRFVTRRARLRELLAPRVGVSPSSIRFSNGRYGKPGIDRTSAPNVVKFNISCSDDVVAFAFSNDHAVGVDIEAIREFPDMDDVAEHCFSPLEIKTYRLLTEGKAINAFYACWTRKEAFVKAIGKGLSYPLDSFDVSLAPDDQAELLRVGEKTGSESGWQLETFDPFPGFAGAVVRELGTN
jgi:4'-phosphopantetheinyl transferase